MDKKVLTKWETEGELAVIYQVGDLLLFYSSTNDPDFKKGEMISRDKAQQTKPYKAVPFTWDNVPSDAYMCVTWGWH